MLYATLKIPVSLYVQDSTFVQVLVCKHQLQQSYYIAFHVGLQELEDTKMHHFHEVARMCKLQQMYHACCMDCVSDQSQKPIVVRRVVFMSQMPQETHLSAEVGDMFWLTQNALWTLVHIH